MSVGWAYDAFMLRHQTPRGHPECPERLEAIHHALADAGLLSGMQPLGVEPAPIAALESVHHPAYVALVELACREGMSFLGSRETRISAESFDAARLGSGAVLAACEAVVSRRVRQAFCAIRPPGHHAESDRAAGYCLFNHVAVGAEYLLRRCGLSRVAIVDWDVHHGNGTQAIFEARSDVLFISIHESPGRLYPHTGYAHERGVGLGEGFTLNIPMPPGSGDREYRRAFEEQILPSLDAFRPACVLVSAGFDAAGADHTADIQLVPASYGWMTRALMEAAESHGDGRLISVLEGGYDPTSLRGCVVEHVRSLMEG